MDPSSPTTEHPNSAGASDPLLGRVVGGRYRIEEAIGGGGYGKVYRAWHLTLLVPVALKVLVLSPLLDGDGAERLESILGEARALTRLRHPNIVAVLDAGTLDIDGQGASTAYLVMEWCSGPTLEAVLAERGRLSLEEAFAILEPIADALGHAHAAGVIHRDVKPSNIVVVDAADRVSPRLIDFGVAKVLAPKEDATGGESAPTTSPSSSFTLAYAAPEQVVGSRTTGRTDVHALGLLFIEMLTGAPPYGEGGFRTIIDAVRPGVATSGIDPGAFGPVIARAVALRPRDRFANGTELHAALREAAAVMFEAKIEPLGESPDARGSPSGGRDSAVVRSENDERKAQRRWALAVAFAGAIAIAAGLVLVLRFREATRGGTSEPSARATPPEPIGPTACDLPASDLGPRLQVLGFSVTETTSKKGVNGSEVGATRMLVLEDENEGAVTVEVRKLMRDDATAREARATRLLQDAAEPLLLAPPLGVAYALDRDCLIDARGPADDARPIRDAAASVDRAVLFRRHLWRTRPSRRDATAGAGAARPARAAAQRSFVRRAGLAPRGIRRARP